MDVAYTKPLTEFTDNELKLGSAKPFRNELLEEPNSKIELLCVVISNRSSGPSYMILETPVELMLDGINVVEEGLLFVLLISMIAAGLFVSA